MSNTKRKDVGWEPRGNVGKEGIVTFRDKEEKTEEERVAVGEIFLAATTMQQLSPSVIYERPTGAKRRGPQPLRRRRLLPEIVSISISLSVLPSL